MSPKENELSGEEFFWYQAVLFLVPDLNTADIEEDLHAYTA